VAEKLELLISAKNQADSALKDARADVRNLEKALRKASDALDETGQGKAKVEQLQRSLDRARRDAKEFAKASKQAATEMEQLGDETARTSRRFSRFKKDSQSAGTQVNRDARKMSGGFAVMGGKALMAGAAVAALGVAAVTAGRKLWDLNGMVGALEQSQIKSNAVFGKGTRAMRRWSKAHSDDFGASTADVMSYAASVQDLLVPMKFSRAEATGMTKDLAGLVPALTAWDKQGRSAGEVTDILTAAIMGEREALKGLGIGISQDAVDAQVDLMTAQGKLNGKTKEQANAMATLALIYQKSGDAQKSYARNSDTIQRRTKAVQAEVADLRDQGLTVLLGLWRKVGKAGKAAGFGNGIKTFSRWLRRNSDAIQGYILGLGSAFLRVAGTALKAGSVMIRVWGYVVKAIAKVMEWAALLDPRLQGVADKANDFAQGIGKLADAQAAAGDKAWELANQFSKQADQAGRAQERAELLRKTLKGIKSRTVKITVDTVVQGFQGLGIGAPVDGGRKQQNGDDPTGDTASPRSRGMASGVLATAHARLSSGIPGTQRVTSGLRFHNLGSPGSDHARGRALDIQGPGLNAYANRVRAAGGYAAFHGSGPSRHLHAVPAGGGVTEVHNHFSATVNNPGSTVDVRAAFRQMAAEADAEARRRGKGWPNG